jgi:Putative prokaryotic signal transducing protein
MPRSTSHSSKPASRTGAGGGDSHRHDEGGGGGGGGGGKLVKVAFAHQQAEAEMIQGLLTAHGIPSMLRRAAGFDVPDFLAAGPREVLVAEEVAEEAREVLEGTGAA